MTRPVSKKSPRRSLWASVDRKKLSFFLPLAAIAILFLISLVGIFTGRITPFASEDGATSSSSRNKITLPRPSFSFKDIFNNTKRGNGNLTILESAPYPKVSFRLQGMTEQVQKTSEVTGVVWLKDDNNQPLTPKPTEWTTSDNTELTARHIQLTNPKLLNTVDNLPDDYKVKAVFKPKYYLAVSIDNITNIDAPITLNQEVPAGDLDDNNTIDGGDFAVLVAEYEKSVSDTNRYKDLNRDGEINGGDFAILVSNYQKSGAEL